MTDDEEFQAIRLELDLNQTDFGALLGRKQGMIKKYENGYPIPERIMEAARCLRANPPPRAPEAASRGRGRPRGHANRPRSQANEAWDDGESPASEAAVVAISPWFWIGLAAVIIALIILWNGTWNRLNPDPDPVPA
jgi:hypothetical protein